MPERRSSKRSNFVSGGLFGPPKNTTYRNISDFISQDYAMGYCVMMVRDRCCPNFAGLKDGAERLFYASVTGSMKDGKSHKMYNLVGETIPIYYHSDSSIVGTILTKTAAYADNLNLFESDSQTGTLRSKQAGAARYLSIQLSSYFDILLEDKDLWEYVIEEDKIVKVKNLFPIIPVCITSSQIGMTPGYKSVTFQFNPYDVACCCEDILKHGKIKTVLRPYVRGIKGSNWHFSEEDQRWYNKGTYIVDVKHSVLQVTDLPFDITFVEYEDMLNDLVEKEPGTFKAWSNYSHDNIIDYRIYFQKGKLETLIHEDKVLKAEAIKKLKLVSPMPKRILNMVDENGKIKYFDDEYQLIEYFVKWRLSIYTLRKNRLIDINEKKLAENSEKVKFIELVNSGEIIINNRSKKDIKEDLKKNGISDSVLSMEIYKLTKEEIDVILKRNADLKAENEYIKTTDIQTMYLNDLKKLKKRDDFKEFTVAS